MKIRESLHRAGAVLRAEIAATKARDLDLDAGDLTMFTLPLLVRAIGLLTIGAVPLLVVRGGDDVDALLIPLIGSVALVIICTAVVSWLTSVIISGLVVMVMYRTGPAMSSRLVMRILNDSFRRISDSSSHLTLVALVAGLLSLAIGLPTRPGDENANSVIDDLLAAQVGVLLAVLAFSFIAESIRSAADIVDDQSLMLAWPWALLIACASWVTATAFGPFEVVRMLTILLNEWLPATVDGVPRRQVIGDLLPPNAKLWAILGPLPVIAVVWAIEAWRRDGFTHVRRFLEDVPTYPSGTRPDTT